MSRLQRKLGRARISRTPTPLTTDDEYESDAASVASVDSLWGNDPESVHIKGKWQDEMLETVDSLNERKGSSSSGREELLKSFVRMASLKIVTEEILEGRLEGFIRTLERTIKNGRTEKEITLVGRAISLITASVPEAASLSTSTLPLLQQTISNGGTGSATPTLISALSSIAFFSPSLTSQEIHPILTFFIEILQSNGHSIGQGEEDNIIVAAIEAFSVLLSVLEDPSETIQWSLPVMVDSLSSSSIPVRLSAGECIALSFELTRISSDSEDESAQAGPYADMNHLVSVLSSLSTTSTKRISKNSRREQHGLFREILHTVTTLNSLSAQKLQFARNEELRIDSWEKLLRLKHLRKIFTHGLHVHLAGNAHVREFLDLPPPLERMSGGTSSEEEDNITSAERRTLQKEVRRLRQGRIRRDRRRAREGRMIDVFGEDISF